MTERSRFDRLRRRARRVGQSLHVARKAIRPWGPDCWYYLVDCNNTIVAAWTTLEEAEAAFDAA
jgi:hypothetical protein